MTDEAKAEPTRLTQKEAKQLVTDLLAAFESFTFGGKPATPEEVATLVSQGMRMFEGRVLIPTENTPKFLREFLDPLLEIQRTLQHSPSELQREIIVAAEKPNGLLELLSEKFSSISKSDAVEVRRWIERVRYYAENPLEVRNQQIAALRKTKGTPGPKAIVPREAWDRIEDGSQKLRPVMRLVLEVMERQRLLVRDAVKRVGSQHPEWKTECDFMLSNLFLIERAMELSKFKRAKIRGRISLLSDAIACQFAGFEVSPAYSMQILEEIRRFRR